ncbi:MAG: hypothetical protein U0271_13570 [Polyangiaceae bacterium]
MKLVKGSEVWFAEQRGSSVLMRTSSAGGEDLATAAELDSEPAALAFLVRERERRLAEGWTIAEMIPRASTTPLHSNNDALDAAFSDLRGRGIVAIASGQTSPDEAWREVREAAREAGSMRGVCFYDAHDLERAVRGHELMLTFAALTDDALERDRDARDSAIGVEVVSILEKHGVAVDWDGEASARIAVRPLEWHRSS